jgi:O-succinylbenzoic acid--CoA ligase
MATAPPFDLNALQREWIAGVSGAALLACVQQRMAAIEADGNDAAARGVLIVEPEPQRFAVAFLAAVYLQVPVIVANPNWRRVEWDAVANLVNPAVIFGDCPLATDARAGGEHPPSATILIPTGGSSGGVKFAIHRWHSLAAACEGLAGFLGAGPIHSCCVLPLFHVSGLMQLVRSLVTGGQIAFPVLQQLQSGDFPVFEPGTMCLSLVPTQLQRLMAAPHLADRLIALRAIFVGGAALPSAVAQQARALKLPLVLSYGMTETAAMVSALAPDEFLAGATNAGCPLSHALIKVIGEDGAVCSVGQVGRIQIAGDSLFQGYHRRRSALSQNGFLTDDEGYVDAFGRLHIVGRSDRLIISGGENIDPLEVEQAILHTGAVEQVLVVGWPDAEWGHKLVAFYTASGVPGEERSWEAELRADLVNYKIPKHMIQVPSLPFNERGKLDRQLIARLLASDVQRLES